MMQENLYGRFESEQTPTQLLFLAKVIDNNEVESKTLSAKMDELMSEMRDMRQDIIDQNEYRLMEVASEIM